MAKKNKTPWFARPLRGKQMRREMNAATRLQFGDQQRQIQAQQRASAARSQDLGDWFGEYQRQLASANQATTQGYNDAESRIAARAAQARQADVAMNNAAIQQAQADAAARGVAFDPSAFQQAGQAASYRQGQDNTLADLTAMQGQNQAAYMNDKSRIGQGELINQRLAEAARARGFENDLVNLAKDKGAFRVDFRNKSRQQERDYMNQKAQMGLDAASIGVKRGYNDAIKYQALMGAQPSRVDNYYHGGSKSGGGGGDVREAVALIRSTSKKKLRRWSDKDLIDNLITSGKGIDASEARKAIRRWRRQKKKNR